MAENSYLANEIHPDAERICHRDTTQQSLLAVTVTTKPDLYELRITRYLARLSAGEL